MNLYIWNENVLTDWKSGLAFALAETEDEARRLLAAKIGHDPDNPDDDLCGLDKPPDEVHPTTEPYAAYLWGSS